MTTLVELVNKNQLVRFDPNLDPCVMEERFVYLLPKAKKWFETVLPTAKSTWKIEEDPTEQVDALMEIFCSGAPLAFDHTFKYLFFRDAAGIWELKTADVRIFGWFPKKDHFIASTGDLAQHVKDHDLYHGYSTQAQRERDLLDLDLPKFIAGDNPNDVVSNWSKA